MSTPERPKWRRVDPSLLLMLGFLVAAVVTAVVREGSGGLGEGLDSTGVLVKRALPFLIVGLTLAGMLQVLIPAGVIGRWMGEEAGTKGLIVGILVGTVTPGGPFIMFPIAAALMNSGAGIGAMGGYTASRNLFAFNRLIIWEIPFLGAPFALARIGASLLMPVITALLVPVVYRLLSRARGPAARDAEGSEAGRGEVP